MTFDIRGLLDKHGKDADKLEAFQPSPSKKRSIYSTGPVVKEPTEKEAEDAIKFINLHGIKVGVKKVLPSGVYGEYAQLTAKLGVKLFKGASFTTKAAAEKSTHFKIDAPKEMKNLKSARAIFGRMVPLCLYAGAIKYDDQWRVGVVVQHIDGIMLNDLEESTGQTQTSLLEGVRKKMATLGYKPNDLHGGNAMLVQDGHENYVYVVDWGNGFVKTK